MICKLRVLYHNQLVGILVLSKENKILFQYDKERLRNGFSISLFKLPLSNSIFKVSSPYFDGLFGVFSDSLPDSYGKLIVEKYSRQKGIKSNEINILDKLSIVGDDAKGALEYEPCEKLVNAEIIDLDFFHKEVTKLLDSKPVKNI